MGSPNGSDSKLARLARLARRETSRAPSGLTCFEFYLVLLPFLGFLDVFDCFISSSFGDSVPGTAKALAALEQKVAKSPLITLKNQKDLEDGKIFFFFA